jgi:hypothetical protein
VSSILFRVFSCHSPAQKKRLIHEAFVALKRGNNYCFTPLVKNLQAMHRFGYCPEVLGPRGTVPRPSASIAAFQPGMIYEDITCAG